jgi:hypothetical protein
VSGAARVGACCLPSSSVFLARLPRKEVMVFAAWIVR